MNARNDFVGLIIPAVADRHGMHIVRRREAGIFLRTCVKGIPHFLNSSRTVLQCWCSRMWAPSPKKSILTLATRAVAKAKATGWIRAGLLEVTGLYCGV